MTTKFFIGADEWPGISKLIEETGEVLQICGKLIAADGDVSKPHWDGQNLRESLENELADLIAALHFVANNCPLDSNKITRRAEAKIALFAKWHEDQKVEGR